MKCKIKPTLEYLKYCFDIDGIDYHCKFYDADLSLIDEISFNQLHLSPELLLMSKRIYSMRITHHQTNETTWLNHQ